MSQLNKFVRALAQGMYALAGAALCAIVILTVTDVVLRLLRHPIVGAYELVGLLGALAIGLAVPQSTLERGHVLMDFLTSRFSTPLRRAVEVLTRLLGVALFFILAVNLWALADDLRTAGEVSPTLQLPQYPVAYALAMSLFVQCLVLVDQALVGREVR